MEILENSSDTHLFFLLKNPHFMALSGNTGDEGPECNWGRSRGGGVARDGGEFSCFSFLTLSQSVFVLVSFKLFHMCPKGPSVSVFYKLEK